MRRAVLIVHDLGRAYSTVCTYGGGGHAAGVSQPFFHPHCGVQESFHAEIPEDRPELLTHIDVGLQLLIKPESLSFLYGQYDKRLTGI